MPFPALHRLRWPLAPLLGALATLGFAPYGQWYLSLLATHPDHRVILWRALRVRVAALERMASGLP